MILSWAMVLTWIQAWQLRSWLGSFNITCCKGFVSHQIRPPKAEHKIVLKHVVKPGTAINHKPVCYISGHELQRIARGFFGRVLQMAHSLGWHVLWNLWSGGSGQTGQESSWGHLDFSMQWRGWSSGLFHHPGILLPHVKGGIMWACVEDFTNRVH